MIEVRWHPSALSEVHRAHLYYLERNEVAAERFRAELDDAIEHIAASPERWRLYEEGARRRRFRHFPYSVVYVTGARVDVIAIAHHRRRPGYWSSRLPP